MAEVVFDVSSDEDTAVSAAVSDDSKLRDDDYDWLTEILRNVDEERGLGGGGGDGKEDEVLVVAEYNPSKPKPRYKSTKHVEGGSDDDDCVILDGDPDKSVAVADGAGCDDGGGDDVVVVGQKGQIACRDYPHPRHDCAKFPFSSTPHENFCDLCHCFVCDSRAPCPFWGTGVSNSDHCHATDKQDIWKSQRERFRLLKKGSLVSQMNHHIDPPVDIAELTTIPPFPIRACSTRMAIPNIISQGRNEQLGYVQRRNVLLPRSGPRQGLSVRANCIRRDAGPNTGLIGRQCLPSNTRFKRPGIIRGGLAMNQSMRVSTNNMNYPPALQCTWNTAPLPMSTIQIPGGQHGALSNLNSESYTYHSASHSNMSGVIASTVPSQSEAYSDPISELNNGQNTYQLAKQTQNVSNLGFSDIDVGGVNNCSKTNQQTSVENFQLQSTGSAGMPSTMMLFDSQLSESPQLLHKDHEYENLFSSQSTPVASESCLPIDLYALSPEPPAVDAGMLYFDFETSFNGLA